MSELVDAAPLTAEEFWRGRCRDCGHPEHEMTCHEVVSNGDPSNGPAYCPCSVQIERMEQEIVRLRAIRASDKPPVAYVGGHPEIPLHPYEPAGDGTCATCTRAAEVIG